MCRRRGSHTPHTCEVPALSAAVHSWDASAGAPHTRHQHGHLTRPLLTYTLSPTATGITITTDATTTPHTPTPTRTTHLDGLHHECHDVWVAFQLGLQRGQVVVRDDLEARHEGSKALQ